ncbi:MAG: hypothetical protein ABI345_15050, partial [Jatrophihabitans sp.]
MANADCSNGHELTGCAGAGSVRLTGFGGEIGPDKGAHQGPSSTLTLSCGTDTTARLRALGDTEAARDGRTCTSQNVACSVAKAQLGTPQDAVIKVRQNPDGSWQYTASDCLTAAKPQVTVALVREQAVRLIPTADVGLAPHGTTLVNIETVMCADAPRTRSLAPVTILGKQVVISLVLDHVA